MCDCKDTERLDWMEEQAKAAGFITISDIGRLSLREKVDAAMVRLDPKAMRMEELRKIAKEAVDELYRLTYGGGDV
jgi:hypothetical protein